MRGQREVGGGNRTDRTEGDRRSSEHGSPVLSGQLGTVGGAAERPMANNERRLPVHCLMESRRRSRLQGPSALCR